MAQTGFTPLLIYSSSTGGNAPTAGNLLNNATGSELAINIADGKLFYKDSGGSVQVIAWKTTPTTAGGTGLTSWTAGQLPYYSSGTALSQLNIGTSGYFLTSSGSAPQWTDPTTLAVTSISFGSTGLTPSTATKGAVTVAGLLATGYGGTGLTGFTAANNAIYSTSSSALTAGTLPVAAGGTGLTSLTANYIPYGNGTGAFSSTSAFTYTSTGLGVGTSATSIIDCRVDQASTTYLTVQNRYHNSTLTQKAGLKLQLGDISESFKWCSVEAYPASAYESGGGITFNTYNGTTPAEVMRMYPTGGVSIGNTTDPGATNLSVNGKCIVSGTAITNIGGSSLNHEVYANGNGAIGGYQLGAGGYVYNSYAVSNGGTYYHVYFSDAGTSHGSITSNGTTTSYNITSDYRLKENVAPMQNALETIAKLNPVTYKWVNSELTGQGFIAHELQEVVPDCVTGEKDAVDKDGNPVYQQMDSSFLIGLLTKSIQELNEKFDAYVASHP